MGFCALLITFKLFSIGFGAFRVSHVLCILCQHHRDRVDPQNIWFSAPAVGSELFFPKC